MSALQSVGIPFCQKKLAPSHNLSLKLIYPILVPLLLILLLEVSTRFTPFQQKLDWWADNPLPLKLAQLEDIGPSKIKILALGTSRTLNGFNAAAFEKVFPGQPTTYNMGLPQAGYDWAYTYLKHHIQRYGKPKVLLLEATDFLLNRSYVTEGYYYHNLATQNPSVLLDVVQNPIFNLESRESLLLSQVSGIHRYRKILKPQILSKILTGKGQQIASTGPNLYIQGWQPLTKSNVGMMTDKLWIQEENYLPIDTRELKAILDYCQQINLPVILVEWPDHESYKRLSDQSKLVQAYENALKLIANSYHIPIINLNDRPEAHNPQFYADIRHLNPYGSAQYSTILAKNILSIPQAQKY